MLRSDTDQCDQFDFVMTKGCYAYCDKKMRKLWIKIARESFRALIPCRKPQSNINNNGEIFREREENGG